MTPVSLDGHSTPRILLFDGTFSGNQAVDVINPGWKRLVFWADVTVNPGAAESIFLEVLALLPSGNAFIVATAASALGGGAGTMSCSMGPGAAAGWGTTVKANFNGLLAQSMRFRVRTTAAGNWTYTGGLDVSF